MAKNSKKKEVKDPDPKEPNKKSNGRKKTDEKSSSKDSDKSAADEDEKKKPQRGLAIGDNFGWTGKLPATLLHEHCQKQKWGKVIFDMKKSNSGFTGIVNLSWTNPKTTETIHVKMIPEADCYKPKETTNEARHYAATYALHRINYMKNMKMILPKIFRDFWTDLEIKRLESLKTSKDSHDRIYNADPFAVYLMQVEEKKRVQREREIKDKNNLKLKKPTISISSTSVSKSKPKRDALAMESLKGYPSFPRKVWERSPFIDFAPDVRVLIERSIKEHIRWRKNSGGSTMSESERSKCFNLLSQVGFRESHVKESFVYTSNFFDSLDWLLFNIPEDDLPPMFLKKEEDSGVYLKISKNIKKENQIKRLRESGFDEDEISKTLEESENDEVKACVKLTKSLVGFIPEDTDVAIDSWEDEIQGIEMIGTNKILRPEDSDQRVVSIVLNAHKLKNDLLEVKLFKSDLYPNDIPGVQLVVRDKSFRLASYIKLAVIRKLCRFILDSQLLGGCFVFSIIEWLEQNIHQIIDDPGPLIENHVSPTLKPSSIVGDKQKKEKKTRGRSDRLSMEEVNKMRNLYLSQINSKNRLESLKRREKLPVWKKREDLVSIINNNKVTIVTGETGSGKSTQIVQFILDNLYEENDFRSTVLCTQPRRISTIGLAETITEERCGQLGDEVGYIIRGENKTRNSTKITFVTTGVLLRMLQSFLSSKEGNTMLDDIKYIFIDEVHERSVDSDFLLIILKRIMNKFPNLRIVLMSATIDTNMFKDFFKLPVTHVHIEGRTFPVENHYLDSILEDLDYTVKLDDEVLRPKADSNFFKSGNINYDLIAKLSAQVDDRLSNGNSTGSILIFLPGIMEINQCIGALEKVFSSNGAKCWCVPLHSALSQADQKKVFKYPPRGSRKIVISTNIAETSITIPDCVVVIDTGRSKTMHYDPTINTTKLIENWCSRAETKQRQGRAGRVTSGTCYHLYSHDTESNMMPQPIPEIKRVRLENLYLVTKSMGINNVDSFLEEGIDVPDKKLLHKSEAFLQDIGALNRDSLTNLGRYLSLIPSDLQSGKILIMGCIFGCIDFCLTVASVSSTGSPFINSFEKRDAIKAVQEKFARNQGDLFAVVNVFKEYENMRNEGSNTKNFISGNFLSYISMREIGSTRLQYISILKEIGFLPVGYSSANDNKYYAAMNRNANNPNIIRAIIAGSYHPNITRVQLPDPKYFQSSNGAIEIDPEARATKFWIRNDEYIKRIKFNIQPKDSNEALPASRAFIHPSSVFISTSGPETLTPAYDEYFKEDGSVDVEKAKELYASPNVPLKSSNLLLKLPFAAYTSSHHTTKLYLRSITPTSTIAVLLFGGEINYDISSLILSGASVPGIVLDNWLPIRTWCKNGVLIKKIRELLDDAIEDILSDPLQSHRGGTNDIVAIVERLLQDKVT